SARRRSAGSASPRTRWINHSAVTARGKCSVSGNGITRPASGTGSGKDHQSRRDVAVARDLLLLRVMGNVWNDLRFSLRMMARQPGFTAILVITLALGIGATTTIFSVVNSVVIKPLPYKDPDQLVR